mmetsp:Transcript_11276/g.42234  ORF Transcript_11276/g.42234 Transcript_11276/m.42234 type:complete len:115 (-) Transcript_11276:321-665(-)
MLLFKTVNVGSIRVAVCLGGFCTCGPIEDLVHCGETPRLKSPAKSPWSPHKNIYPVYRTLALLLGLPLPDDATFGLGVSSCSKTSKFSASGKITLLMVLPLTLNTSIATGSLPL